MRTAVATLPIVLALLASGCGGEPDTVAVRTYQGVPDQMPPDSAGSSEPQVVWEQQGSTFAVTTYGSSTCPAVATRLVGKGNSVRVGFEPNPQKNCTADLAPTTHIFDLPIERSSAPVTVEITGLGEPVRASLQ